MIFEIIAGVGTVIGIILGIIAFSAKNIGYALQKYGVNKSGLDRTAVPSGEGGGEVTDLLKTKIWWVGNILTFIGAASLAAAYNFEPRMTVVMPFMGVGMVVLVLFCKFYLGENVTPKEWMAAAVIILGIIMVTSVGEPEDRSGWPISRFYEYYLTPQSVIFFALSWGIITAAIIWSIKNGWKGASIIFGIAAGDFGGTTLLFQTPFSVGFSYLGGELEPGFWGMWIGGFIGFLIGGFLAIMCVNIGYMHGEGILVAPIYATTQMLFPIIGGIVVFREWTAVTPFYIILIQTAGFAIIGIGVFMLSYYNERKKRNP